MLEKYLLLNEHRKIKCKHQTSTILHHLGTRGVLPTWHPGSGSRGNPEQGVHSPIHAWHTSVQLTTSVEPTHPSGVI